MKTRWVVLGLALGFLSAAGLAAVGLFALLGRRPPALTPPVRPFTDLETALAQEAPLGWELHRPPQLHGPYRMVPGGSLYDHKSKATVTSRITDDEGRVLEEVRLEATEFDQLVVFLETLHGRRTIAVLKRVR